jgi:hypothetical protein
VIVRSSLCTRARQPDVDRRDLVGSPDVDCARPDLAAGVRCSPELAGDRTRGRIARSRAPLQRRPQRIDRGRTTAAVGEFGTLLHDLELRSEVDAATLVMEVPTGSWAWNKLSRVVGCRGIDSTTARN